MGLLRIFRRVKLTDEDRKMVYQHLYGERGWSISQIASYYYLRREDVLRGVQEKYPEAK